MNGRKVTLSAFLKTELAEKLQSFSCLLTNGTDLDPNQKTVWSVRTNQIGSKAFLIRQTLRLRIAEFTRHQDCLPDFNPLNPTENIQNIQNIQNIIINENINADRPRGRQGPDAIAKPIDMNQRPRKQFFRDRKDDPVAKLPTKRSRWQTEF
jgi:hypothetical protein